MKHRLLSSFHNPHIKALLKLRRAQKIKRTQRFCVEGAREIEQARKRFELLELYVQEETLSEQARAVVAACTAVLPYTLTTSVYAKLAVRENKDGLIAVFAARELPLSELRLSDCPLLVVCQELQKPGNLGAMIRTTLAVGADALLAVEQKMHICNPNVIRASLGYVFTLPMAVASSAEVVEFLQANNINIAVADGSQPGLTYTDYDFTAPTAIVFGSEAEGLSPFWRERNVTRLHIPMCAAVDALNVSVCGGIILYEAWRQRQVGMPPRSGRSDGAVV